MEVVLKKYGNSTVAVPPPPVLRDLGINADLIAQCNRRVAPPADMILWDVASPVGKEVW